MKISPPHVSNWFGSRKPVARGTDAPGSQGTGSTSSPASQPVADGALSSRPPGPGAGASSAPLPQRRTGILPRAEQKLASVSRSADKMIAHGKDVMKIVGRRPAGSLVGAAMDLRDMVRGGAGPLAPGNAEKALSLLKDPAIANGLSTAPIYVRPLEHQRKNQAAYKLEAGTRLNERLDAGTRYLWVMTAPKTPGALPDIHIGREYASPGPNGKSGNLGHPTVLNQTQGDHVAHRALFAGELLCENGQWMLDNNSGRWFGSNAALLQKQGLHKADLFAAAAHCINEKTDLHITQAKQYSRNPLRFVEQQIGLHQPRLVNLDAAGAAEKKDAQ